MRPSSTWLQLTTGSGPAVAVLSLGGGDAALTLALFGAGLSPVLILAGVLLSAKAAKSYKRGPIFLAGGAAAAAGLAMLWPTSELGATVTPTISAQGAIGPWLAALLFATAIGCAGLLGYGERGPFESAGAKR